MAFQRVPDTVEATIVGSVGGQECVNTFYGQQEGYSLADIEALATAVDAWVGSDWLHLCPVSYSYLRTDVRGLNASIDIAASRSVYAGAGLASTCSRPNNASLAVSRRSGYTGRGARGRIYLPPLPDAAMADDNHVTGAFATLAEGYLAALDGVFTGAGFVPVIVHRVAAGVPLAEAVVFTLLEWVVVDTVVDSMRRRLPGRGV